MAPKQSQKRKEASSSQTQEEERHARLEARDSLKRRPIVVERELADESTLHIYRAERGWKDFLAVERRYYNADRSIFFAFVEELIICPTVINKVPVKGKMVDISPRAINAFFRLPDIQADEYTTYATGPIDTVRLTARLTGEEQYLHPNWRFIPKKWLTQEAKIINLFVSCCLMPTQVNSEVLRKRALLIYALLEGMTIDVGKVINAEIHASVDAPRKGQSIGFPALITTLCIRAGACGNVDSLDRIPWPGEIRGKDFCARGTPGASSSQAVPPEVGAESSSSEEEAEVEDPWKVEMRQEIVDIRSRMESFFTYQMAVNDFLMQGREGERPTFPTVPQPPPPPPS